MFDTEDEREKAKTLIKEKLLEIIPQITEAQHAEWSELDRQGVLEETGWPAHTIFRRFTFKKRCTPADNTQRIKIDLKQKIERSYLTSEALAASARSDRKRNLEVLYRL